jgi:DNA-binding MarR family transcriptional regulator
LPRWLSPLSMSKKTAKSERDIDLPNWADEVTPSDEVMKKFYAPTGTFKPGPINNQQPAAPVPEPPSGKFVEGDNEGIVDNQLESAPVRGNAPGKTVLTSSASTSIAEEEDTTEKASLLSSSQEIQSPSAEKPTTPYSATTAVPIGQASKKLPRDAQNLSFEEFAKKWKRYLYPGQLAVMRTLFDLTIARGTTECFTQYSEIAAATKMTRRNCINVMNALVERGFVKRLEIRNDATGKGIKLRIHADPLL